MEKKTILIKDIMRTSFGRIDREETVRTALSIMADSNARALIVNKRDKHDELGIVVLVDIAKQVLAKDKSPDRVNVYEIMSKPVVQVAPDMDIRYCARLFERFGLERAPVVENGEVLGIVSYPVLVLRGLMQYV